MNPLCANIETPDYISWRSISTLRTTVRPLMFASLPADRTSTRGICFVDFNRSGQFVVKLFNNSAIGGGGNALRSFPIHFLRRVVEWLPYISFGVRKFIRNPSSRLMNLIGYPIVRFSQRLGLSLLKPFPPTRALHPRGLSSLNLPKPLVPVPNFGFDRSTGDANRLFSIGRGNQGIDSKVEADHRSYGSPFWFRALKNKKGLMPAGPNLHQTSRKFKIRKFDAERPRLSVRQEKKSLTNPRPLIGIDHITALDFLPGVLGVLRTFLSQLTSGFYSFEKFTDDLLNRLTVKLRVSSFGPLFPSTLRWPCPMGSTNPEVTFNEIIPEPCGFFAGLVINAPLDGACWREFYFYCAVNHNGHYIIDDSCGKWYWPRSGRAAPNSSPLWKEGAFFCSSVRAPRAP